MRFRSWRNMRKKRSSLMYRLYELREFGPRYQRKIEMQVCGRFPRSKYNRLPYGFIPILAYQWRIRPAPQEEV
jgi:hypothetical protein